MLRWFSVAVVVLSLGGCERETPSEPAPSPEVAERTVEPPVAGAAPLRPPKEPSALLVREILPGFFHVQAAALTELALDVAEGDLRASAVDSGWRIDAVRGGSVGARLGLVAGDEIAAVGERPVGDLETLRRAFLEAATEGRATVHVRRGAETVALDMLLIGDEEPSRLERVETLLVAVERGVRTPAGGRRTIDRAVLTALGTHVGSVPAEDLWARMGVPDGARVAEVGNKPVVGRRDRVAAFAALSDARTFELEALSTAGRLVLEYEVVEGELSDEDLERATEGIRGMMPTLPEADPALVANPGIECKAEGDCTVPKAGLEALMAAPASLAKQVRVVPHFADGKAIGFKLFGVRPKSIPQTLGFKNGDLLLSVNGLPMTGVDAAMNAFAKLRTAKTLKFEVRRVGGTTETLTLEILE